MDRTTQIVDAALDLLESGGPDALSMRAIAEAVGMRAPSLYKHFPDKRRLEAALVERGFRAQALAFQAASDSPTPLVAIARTYRAWALAHPHLYRLMTERPLPRELLPDGVEDSAAAPLVAIAGTLDRARALWGLAHGLVSLELAARFPADADIEAAWQAGIDAFTSTHDTVNLTR